MLHLQIQYHYPAEASYFYRIKVRIVKFFKQILVTTLVVLSAYSSLKAQNLGKRDSLLSDIASTDDDLKKIVKESDFIIQLTAKSVPSAETFTDSLIGYYKERNDTLGWARMISMKAYVALFDNRREELVKLSREAYELQNNPLRDTAGLALTLIRMGLGSSYFERYDEAITRTERALTYFKLLNNDRAVDLALNNLGVFKNGIGDKHAAIRLYKESAQIRKRLGKEFWYGCLV